MTKPTIHLTPGGRAATISLADGRKRTIAAETLWDACPGAKAKRRRLDGAAPHPAGLAVTGLADVGYGLHVAFSHDAHGGVFPWPMLLELCMRPQMADFIASDADEVI